MQSTAIRRAGIVSALLAMLATSACSGMNSREQRILSGGAIGAAAGAAVGLLTGGAAVAAIVGGAAGATGGYLYDQQQHRTNTVRQSQPQPQQQRK